MKTLTKPGTVQRRMHPAPPPGAWTPAHARPARHPHTRRRSNRLVFILPVAFCLLFIAAHLTGIALLNYESARRTTLEKEIQQLQQQNEALRMHLNALTAEPVVQHWAQAQGMVRAETQSAAVVSVTTVAAVDRPLAMVATATRPSQEGEM